MKICVIGAGRVGYPLALMLDDAGHNVSIFDTNNDVLGLIERHRPLFSEPGFERMMLHHRLEVSYAHPRKADVYIVAVPTNVGLHNEIEIGPILSTIDTLYLSGFLEGALLVFRSTLAPGTIDMIQNYIYALDPLEVPDYMIAYCPERIAEGNSYNELKDLPQIISADSTMAFNMCTDVFSYCDQFIKMTFAEAELAKVFTNAYRYVHFSISNWMAMIAEKCGVDFVALSAAMKYDYPRLETMPSPGLVGGVCLRKDFAMLSGLTEGADLGSAAHQINEKYALNVARHAVEVSLSGKIGILGMTFKADSDDLRDSLAVKVAKEIFFLTGRYPIVHDPYLRDSTYAEGGYIFTNDYASQLEDCDTIIIGANHTVFQNYMYAYLFDGKYLIDPSGRTIGVNSSFGHGE